MHNCSLIEKFNTVAYSSIECYCTIRILGMIMNINIDIYQNYLISKEIWKKSRLFCDIALLLCL